MATVASLVVKLKADTANFSKGLDRASSRIGALQKRALPASKALVGGFVAAGAAAIGLGTKAVNMAADLEQAEVAFTTLLGSGEAASKMITDLQNFAAKTPFQFPGLQDAARQLVAFGIDAEDTIPTLQRIGDVSAGIGAPIGEIAEVYGKARVQGRLFAEDINQLTGRGIPIIGELAKQFGVTEEEVRGLVESGQVNFGHLEKAFISLTSEGGKFAGLMEAQSQTLGGLWSTLKDNLGMTLASIGNTIVDTFDLKGVTEGVIERTGKIRESFEGMAEGIKELGLREYLEKMFSPEIRGRIVAIAGAIAGGLFVALKALAGAIIAATLPLLPFIAAGAALAAMIHYLWETQTGFRVAVASAWTAIQMSFAVAVSYIKSILSELQKFWDTWGATIMSAVSRVFQVILQVITTVINTIKNVIGLVLAVIQGDWSEAWERIKAITSGVWELLKSIISLAIDVIKGILSAAWEFIKSTATSAWEAIKNAIATRIEAAKNTINNVLTAIRDFWASIWARITNKTIETLALIRNTISEKINNAKTFLSNAWDAIYNKVASIWNSIKAFISTRIEAVRSTVSNVLTTIRNFWSNIWTNIKNTTANIISTVRNTIVSRINAVKNFLSGAWSNIYSAAVRMWDNMKRGVTTRVTTLKNTIKTKIDDAVSYIKGLPAKAVAWGQDLIWGLWEGIKGMGWTLKNNVTSWVKDHVPGPILSVLGIDSPSKVFMEMGQDIGLGLEKGILGSKRMIEQASTSLAQATVPGKGSVYTRNTVEHAGVIRIEGVDSQGQFVDAVSVILEGLDNPRVRRKLDQVNGTNYNQYIRRPLGRV